MKKAHKHGIVKSFCKSVRKCTPDKLRMLSYRFGTFMAAGADSQKRHFPDMRNTLQALSDHGFKPAYCVDVGAYKGEWTIMFKELFPLSRIMMIEPQQDKARVLLSLCDSFAG